MGSCTSKTAQQINNKRVLSDSNRDQPSGKQVGNNQSTYEVAAETGPQSPENTATGAEGEASEKPSQDRALPAAEDSDGNESASPRSSDCGFGEAAVPPRQVEDEATTYTHEESEPGTMGVSQSSSSSRLENTQRRRLSVSTVKADPSPSSVLPQSSSTLSASFEQQLKTSEIPTEDSDDKIVKHNDIVSLLYDQKRSTVHEVSVEMLLNLFKTDTNLYMVFGCPSYAMQREFDNKQLDIRGGLVDKIRLDQRGIGYCCKKGLKPESPNQDDFFLMLTEAWSFFGVFDGHGPAGHHVSTFVHRLLPYILLSDPALDKDPVTALTRAFQKCHQLLEAASDQKNAYIDCTLSGTTGTVLAQHNSKLYAAHVGDSRGVLCRRRGDEFVAVDLTEDHKPTRQDERRRIEENGGEVKRLEGDIPYRVFVRGRMYPGLAMSRAIGDTVGAAVGVVPDPDVSVWNLTSDDLFVIVASDGVWEFIGSQEAVDYVRKLPKHKVQEAAEELVNESWRRWVSEEEGVVDDITCIVYWLDRESHDSGQRPHQQHHSSHSRKQDGAKTAQLVDGEHHRSTHSSSKKKNSLSKHERKDNAFCTVADTPE